MISYILIILIILNFNSYSKSIIYHKILIKENANISQMFLNSVKLYNSRLSNINDVYNSVVRYKGEKKAIIVLLFYNEIKAFIKRNYEFLKQKYFDKLIFYVTENITEKSQIYKNITYNIIDVSNIFFNFPYKFNESGYTPFFKKRGKWNYQHMCRFFFRDIFLHPSLNDVDMYMRLDSESKLNTTINLFEYMKESKVYMHNTIFNDAKRVIEKLKDFTESYVSTLKIEIKDKTNYNNAFNNTVLSYYNNFEICRMNFFRTKEVIQFTHLVDFSYGQFIYRWGDAPLRFITLSLFSRSDAKISIPKNIDYCHKKCNKKIKW